MTPLELMWSGWRATYVRAAGERRGEPGAEKGDGRSIFTAILESGLSDIDTHIIYRGPFTFAILNAYPYSVGHILVMPYREIADLDTLNSDETIELWATVTTATRAVKVALAPQGLNVGLNLGQPAGGSVSEHLHVHVVPRWSGDANFMTTTGNTRTLPEALPDTAARLRNAWPAA